MKKHHFSNHIIKLTTSLLYILIIVLTLNDHQSECTATTTTTSNEDGLLKTVKLKHIFHHGSTRFPNLIKRKDFSDFEILAKEQSSGIPFTHTIRAINETSVRPTKQNAINEFRLRSQNEGISTIIDWDEEIKLVPDIKDYRTLINLAKMTYNAYLIDNDAIDWYDIGKEYPKNQSFGWEEDGVRGHVFTSQNNELVIIAIKGTSMELNGPTTKRDKINDNLLFSCCCAKVDRTWSGVCDCHRGNYNCDIDCLQESVDKESDESLYYKVVLNLFDNMASEFQDSKVWLIGHSLGGSLASLLGLTHGLPVVAYEAPGERRAAKKLHLPGPPAVPYELLPIWHIGQTADPIYMGLCNGITSWCYLGGYAMETKCHVGKACVFDVVEKLKWGVSLKTHSIKEVIEKILTLWNVTYNFALPECKHEHECEDCGLWNYS
ncbi:19535_t:CDS:2 [Entrophospora sp. SA101]|nr:8944_t:CDS:2 [Entrophospora sp. SA101]CAJ0747375.1 19535_t:CDS:2 [Entrophospora sp. SA101]CAJ0879477.1 8532_t:CDS:2 [Entrophospora sp. SA101]CAJ0909817.1 8708_t:CDS:2 [Entrophospora sp. SA101]